MKPDHNQPAARRLANRLVDNFEIDFLYIPQTSETRRSDQKTPKIFKEFISLAPKGDWYILEAF